MVPTGAQRVFMCWAVSAKALTANRVLSSVMSAMWMVISAASLENILVNINASALNFSVPPVTLMTGNVRFFTISILAITPGTRRSPKTPNSPARYRAVGQRGRFEIRGHLFALHAHPNLRSPKVSQLTMLSGCRTTDDTENTETLPIPG